MNEYLTQEQSICRLIDNQLSESDRAELLLAADRQPELWRKITLAFIEEQVWCAAISGQISGQNGESNLQTHSDRTRLTKNTTSSSAQSIKPWWLALAAAALITATISVRMMTIGIENNADMPSIDRDAVTKAFSEPYMLEMGDQKVPLYEQSDSMSDFLARSEGQLSPELLQYLQTAGLDVQPKTRYITGNAPDGRSFVFPVKQYSVRSRFQ